MNKTLEFAVTIHAPRALVWKAMLEPAGYEAWTSAFTEGSCFSGSRDQGQPIRFLAPNGDGVVAGSTRIRIQASDSSVRGGPRRCRRLPRRRALSPVRGSMRRAGSTVPR